MKLWSDSFDDGGVIPADYALGKHSAESHSEFAGNRNPHLKWSDLPEGTKSLAIICVDVDCPTSAENVNVEGMTVPADLTRTEFYHWVLVDLRADKGEIAAGEYSEGPTPKGKDGPSAPGGARQGVNSYTQWFEGNDDMAGDYFGYDGPYPPWNDERVHHYQFTLYALNTDRVEAEGTFSAPDVLKAIEAKTLDSASITGSYHIYPDAK